MSLKLTADVALPCVLLAAMGCFFLKLAWDTMRADPGGMDRLRRRAKSPKHVVLGMVEPGDNYGGGMACKRLPDGKIVIVRTNQITKADLDEVYRR